MRLHVYTRKLAECRKRWNRGSLRYVLAAASILRRARVAARTKRRWGRWIDEETSMSKTTVYRYLKVALLIKANVSLMTLFEKLGLNKIFTLLPLRQKDVARILANRKLVRLSDIQFKTFVRRFKPGKAPKVSTPNLVRALDASLRRLDEAVLRWRTSHLTIPPEIRAQLVVRLKQLIRETRQDSRMAV